MIFPGRDSRTSTLGASNFILAFPFTKVAAICMITASIVYAELQPWQERSDQIVSNQRRLYLGRHELHTESPTIQDISSAQHRVNHPHKRRVEREGVLEHEGEQDVVLPLPLLERHQVRGQGRVGVHPADLDIPLVQRVVHQLDLTVTTEIWLQ